MSIYFVICAGLSFPDNCNLIATVWEFIYSLVHRPFLEITTSKFVKSRQLLRKTEMTISKLELEGSTSLIVIALSNYSNKSGSK